jgi:hypothetical protein
MDYRPDYVACRLNHKAILMTLLATLADVQARSAQPLDDEQQARAAVLLADASAIISHRGAGRAGAAA